MKNQGLFNKYIIFKNLPDGRLDEVDANADYFVLRLDSDPAARAAAITYASKIAKTNPELAKDLRSKVKTYKFIDKLRKRNTEDEKIDIGEVAAGRWN